MVKYTGKLKEEDVFQHSSGTIIKVISIIRGSKTWDVKYISNGIETIEPCYDFEKFISNKKWEKIN